MANGPNSRPMPPLATWTTNRKTLTTPPYMPQWTMASEHRPQRTVKRTSSADRKAAAALNPTAASLLGFLHLGDLTGYQVMQLAEMIIGDFWSLTRSQVYRELAGLAESGLIEAGEIGTRSQRPYHVT